MSIRASLTCPGYSGGKTNSRFSSPPSCMSAFAKTDSRVKCEVSFASLPLFVWSYVCCVCCPRRQLESRRICGNLAKPPPPSPPVRRGLPCVWLPFVSPPCDLMATAYLPRYPYLVFLGTYPALLLACLCCLQTGPKVLCCPQLCHNLGPGPGPLPYRSVTSKRCYLPTYPPSSPGSQENPERGTGKHTSRYAVCL